MICLPSQRQGMRGALSLAFSFCHFIATAGSYLGVSHVEARKNPLGVPQAWGSLRSLQNCVDAKSKTQNKLVPINKPNVPHLHAQMMLQVEIQKN